MCVLHMWLSGSCAVAAASVNVAVFFLSPL
jgi:hypothetical protein